MAVNLFSGGSILNNLLPQIKIRYPRNWVEISSAGHVLERNNTKEGERFRLIHAKGNFIDMDEKKNTNIVSYNDLIVLADHNVVIRCGEDPKTDKLVLQVIGDVNLYVEGDMHTEVEGNRYDMVNGNWQQECKGVYSLIADENMVITSKNQMKLNSNSYENKTTFLLNDLSEGGSIKENVKGNYEVKIQKETATFSVRSEGDIRTEALKCRYEKTDGNVIQQVGGKIKTNIDGGSISCIAGGSFDGMASAPSSNSYDITVSGVMNTSTSGNYVVAAGGNIDLDATAIYLN
tara:strand:- start:4745 stop:5614 length:870 start_codon:yes stop_codon:yes gene_type:complete